ncbi:MAG: hypothetical protein KatS3mg008_2024 [Acidimicrobiales bacterium]|nr:MAG: hypothetical protein KatS3mg008_2024 [Acidimicrobiales bacterium]
MSPSFVVRIRYAKFSKVRFLSHRDMARLWERAWRRAALPLRYSLGLQPRARLSFGLALPTGAESVAEYLDVHLPDGETVGGDLLRGALAESLPSGVQVLAAGVLRRPSTSLQESVTSNTWELWIRGTPSEIDQAIGRFEASASVPVQRERKGKVGVDDAKEFVSALRRVEADVVRRTRPDGLAHVPALAEGGWVVLVADLVCGSRSLRPSELVSVLGLGDRPVRLVRSAQWTTQGSRRAEPLPLPTAADAHVGARA